MSVIEPRPYHHGDLHRALIDAARHLLETEGLDALSLRAVARQAGVSPGAPYHHFKDKSELLVAVANQGFEELAERLRETGARSPVASRLTDMGAAYAAFAASRRALYRVMTNAARTRGEINPDLPGQAAVIGLMREATAVRMAPDATELDRQLTTVAAFAAIHGLADFLTFKVLEPIKDQCGSEEAFLKAVMEHLGAYSPKHR